MKLKITVHGIAYEVDVEVLDPGEGFAQPSALPPVQLPNHRTPDASVAPPRASAPSAAPGATASESAVSAPIAGTVIEIRCKEGEQVEAGQVVLVLEAMKMKSSISTPTAGVVKAVPVAVGDTVREGQLLVEFE